MSRDGADVGAVVERLRAIRERCAALGNPDVAVVAVTKSFGIDEIRAAHAAGCEGIGENYAQELLQKVEMGLPDVPVHFIGHIQSNKIRSLMGHVDLWQSVDRGSVVEELARRAGDASPRILLQVNVTDEPQKGGVHPTGLDGLRGLAESRGLMVEGLMTVGPTGGSPSSVVAAFSALRALVDAHGLPICSMGMSEDYQLAVECGATMIRLGSALFGPRAPRHR